MRYQVIGDTMPAVEVVFDAAGETMYTQSGGMAWMSEGVSMDSNMTEERKPWYRLTRMHHRHCSQSQQV